MKEKIRTISLANNYVFTRSIKLCCLFFSLSLSFFQGYTQETPVQISGLVIDSETKTPLPGANVYLEQTTVGTVTTDSGTFVLNIPAGNYNVIVSYVGYKPFSAPAYKDKNNQLVAALIPDIKMLNEVAITVDPNWPEYFSLFKMFFLGKNSNQCEILNPKVLTFNYTKGTYILTAEASQPLIIENRALGYKLHYDLTSFIHYTGRTSYTGFTRFEELPAVKSKEKKLWRTNREQFYLGSPNHFMHSLISNQSPKDQFIIKKLDKRQKLPVTCTLLGKWPENGFQSTDTIVTLTQKVDYPSPDNMATPSGNIANTKSKVEYNVLYPGEVQPGSIVTPTETANIFKVSFDHSLFVAFKNKTATNTSIITMLAPYALADTKGNLENPNALLYEGYWGTLRVGDQLPIDYIPENSRLKKVK